MPSLADRIAANKRKRALIEEQEQALKTKERQARMRRIVTAGEVVEKAGLLKLETETIYGALLSLQTGATDPDTIKRWTVSGRKQLEIEAAEKAKVRVPILITFPDRVTKVQAAALKKAGFAYSKLFSRWEGMSTTADAEQLATLYGGQVRLVGESDDELPMAAE